MTTTIHVVFHAHLDPIWLWQWTAGLDEVLATSRSACDRLDAHPDLFYTQGEAWSFALVERADPRLFARIRAHVASGRWEVVNGWWTQPDCNFPSIEGLRRQLSTGLDYVKDRFGLRPRCGFNPDSFGHCAAIPDLLREAGQDRYVFLRPQEHEMTLPSRLFSWRSQEGSPAITAFRIANSYNNGYGGIDVNTIRRALDDMPTGCTHALTLAGIGNHGGGPSDRLIRWFRDNRDALPGARMEFSTIDRFFNAVEGEQLPTVTGELQMHAIGCYTVARNVKAPLRKAEHLLARAEEAQALPAADLDRAWRTVCAHHFHDTLGGTLIPEAFPAVEEQLAGACAVADEALAFAVRSQTADLPPDALPRLVLVNPGKHRFTGWAEANVYLEGPWQGPWGLRDDAGKPVSFQVIHHRTGTDPGWCWGLRRVLVHVDIPAGGLLTLRMDTSLPQPAGDLPAAQPWPGVELALADDPTDTWSHGIDRFTAVNERAEWKSATSVDRGPLMSSSISEGTIGDSLLTAEWRSYRDHSYRDLLLTVNWRERHRVLKLQLPLTGEATRIDGTPGMALARANNGREVPLHDWTRFTTSAVVCPDAWALDADPQLARFTLLRSPHLAHHDPAPAEFPRAVVADHGVHRFRFRFHAGAVAPDLLAAEALAWHRPPLIVECTHGMPLRLTEG